MTRPNGSRVLSGVNKRLINSDNLHALDIINAIEVYTLKWLK